ncbi:SusC/RagA family TonB-linked outer membrane protein, partial [Parabacteroides sp.]
MPPEVSQKKHTLKGVVLDNNTNEPIIGAAVLVTGTGSGTTTDIDGNYQLEVPANAKSIEISYIGYEKKVMPFDGRNLNDFRVILLKEEGLSVDEVTIVAFSKQKKESVISSIATVKPKELKVPSSNLTTALAGRVAGLISYQRSGEPGQDNANFFIRGVTTFGYKADPLILIDGVELSADDLARLQPDDIESFSIMKDATSSALYGARGANGVILVTTKEGVEGKLKIAARFENSFSSPIKNIELADPITYMVKHNEAVSTRDPLASLPYSQEKIDNTIAGTNDFVYPAVDWYKMLFKDVTSNQRFNMNLSGGGRVARYYVAMTYNHDNGILNVDKRNNFNSNISLNKISVRSNVNMNLTKTTELITRMSGTFDDYSGPLSGGSDMFSRVVKANPVKFPAYYEKDANNIYTNHILFGNAGTGNYINPYADLVKGYKEYSQTLLSAQVELKQNFDFITKGLNARVMVNTTRHSYFDVS